MAYETESTPSVGQRIQGFGQGLAKVGEAIQGGMDWAQRRKMTEQSFQQVAQQMETQRQRMEAEKLNGFMLAQDKVGDIVFDAAMTKDPGAAVELAGPRLEKWSGVTGQPYDPEAYKSQAKNLNKIAGGPGGAIDRLQRAKAGISVGATPEAAKRYYEDGMKAVQELSPYVASDLIGRKRDVLDQSYADFQKHYAQMEQYKLKLSSSTQTKPSPFESTLQKAQATDFNKQLEAMPEMRQRLVNLEDMKKVISSGQVGTGEISGTSLAQSLQRMNTPEAQELTYLLSQEGVNAIMNFAKQAGVRAVDTEPERQFILRSVASAKYSPKILGEIIDRTKSIVNKALERINSKQSYYLERGNLSGFGAEGDGSSAPKPNKKITDLHSLMPKVK